jgi:ABC transporter with metal-binding/Fe-S-binding domain ATP-binding protein
MRVCCLFSGGKDSAYALHRMLLSGFDVPVLLTIRSKDPSSPLFHTPGMEVSHLFEGLTGIRTEVIESPDDPDAEQDLLTGVLKDLKARYDLDAVCTGALLSDFQRMRFAHAAMDAGLICYSPLWRKEPKRYMEDLLSSGLEHMLISYSSAGFLPEHLGKIMDNELLEKLFRVSDRWGSHPAFEGGEAETMVLGGPLFPKRLEVKGSVVVEGQHSARFMIEEASLR